MVAQQLGTGGSTGKSRLDPAHATPYRLRRLQGVSALQVQTSAHCQSKSVHSVFTRPVLQGELRGVALQYRKCALDLQQLKDTFVLFAKSMKRVG